MPNVEKRAKMIKIAGVPGLNRVLIRYEGKRSDVSVKKSDVILVKKSDLEKRPFHENGKDEKKRDGNADIDADASRRDGSIKEERNEKGRKLNGSSRDKDRKDRFRQSPSRSRSRSRSRERKRSKKNRRSRRDRSQSRERSRRHKQSRDVQSDDESLQKNSRRDREDRRKDRERSRDRESLSRSDEKRNGKKRRNLTRRDGKCAKMGNNTIQET